ncbi:HNH endonuclease family protein [Streptomyces sp. JV176]|uniref:HNH endonuclease family protein n=1 Tax=Streptomyces sp. JV176 TaxID=858630 RepID=UPI002E772E24|nr:HNH endonuclease family protein [Streptomyces sp. JV176]MEE1797559.1 HNH endonuclease family protein [Streptomyces sp. JV176]
MTARRIASLAAALLATLALTACSVEMVEADDARPNDAGPAVSEPATPSGAAGGPAPDLSLADAIAKLPVATEVRDGYERDSFKHWVDEDSDTCNTRAEVLKAEAVVAPEQGPRCTLTGGQWFSYYDEVTVDDPKKLDIDHMVPLAESWDSGASEWTAERREAYANDLGAERSLLAVTAKTNRSKSDKDPQDWMPPAESARCTYLVDWTATKLRWSLSADEAEVAALRELAADCPDSTVQYELAL